MPLPFQMLWQRIQHRLTSKAFVSLSDPKRLSKANTLYQIIPVRILNGVLSITNPLKMVDSLLSLFFARPLGAKSLLQRMFRVIVDMNKTTQQLKEIQKEIPWKHVKLGIAKWVELNYIPIPHIGDEDLSDHSEEFGDLLQQVLSDIISPSDPPLSIDSDAKEKLTTLLQLEMRKKDKQEFIEFLGDEELMKAVKSLMPVLYKPLIEIYSNADIPALNTAFFDMFREALKIMKEDTDQEAKKKQLEKATQVFGEALFVFIQTIVKADKGTLRDLLSWGLRFFEDQNYLVVDLQSLAATLPKEEQRALKEEITSFLSYQLRKKEAREQGKEKEESPSQQTVPKLVKRFLETLEPCDLSFQ